jgi:Na+-driven multidrug efflux pump
VISLGNVVTHLYLGLNALLRASGSPQKSMFATIMTVIINLILAPLFIYGFHWGIRGAALATVIAQTTMLLWQIRLFNNKENFIHLQKGIFRLKQRIVKDSMAIGLAPFLMNAVSCVIVIVVNKGLIKYGGDLEVGAYGIVNRVAFLFIMVVMGLTQGMQPIAGYNYGARQIERVNKVLKYTILLATGVTTIGFLICEIMPHSVAALFTKDQTLIELAIPGLRIVFIFYPIIAFQMVTGNFFQSIGLAYKAIFMSLSRQLLFLLPGLIFLPQFVGVKGVWYSFPAADILSSVIAASMLIAHYRKSVQKIDKFD